MGINVCILGHKYIYHIHVYIYICMYEFVPYQCIYLGILLLWWTPPQGSEGSWPKLLQWSVKLVTTPVCCRGAHSQAGSISPTSKEGVQAVIPRQAALTLSPGGVQAVQVLIPRL